MIGGPGGLVPDRSWDGIPLRFHHGAGVMLSAAFMGNFPWPCSITRGCVVSPEHGGYAKYPQNGRVIGFTEAPIESRADTWGVNAFS